MKAINISQNIVVVENLEVADTSWLRMKGLLGREGLSVGSGLLITKCNSIHMFFMKFPLDVIFLDDVNKVVGLVKNIPPFALSPIFWKAKKAIELTAGTIDRTNIKVGDGFSFLFPTDTRRSV